MSAATVAADAMTAEEFRAATGRAAVFASDAGRLRLSGEDARDLLNRLSTNLVDPAGRPGEVAVTVLTSDRGRIVDLVYVVHCDDHQLLLTSAGQQGKVMAFLDRYTIMEDLEVEDITEQTAMLTLTGPAAAAILSRAQPGGALVVAAPDNSDHGPQPATYYLLTASGDAASGDAASGIAAALESAGAVQISRATAETLRISQGRPAYGAELSDAYNPLEAGLIGAIDFHKGCYIGQEVIARLDTYRKVQKYLVSLRFEGEGAEAGGIASELPGARLADDTGKAVGLVTSAVRAPGLDGAGAGAELVGLGYVRTAAVRIGGKLAVESDGATGIVAVITAQPRLFGGEKPGPGA